jgi:demethylspheroidene O-methyltransferase
MRSSIEIASLALGQVRAASSSVWLDRCFSLRNRVLADPKFQRWAAGFPVTRKIAQRRAQTLFEILSQQPLSLAEIAKRLSLSLDSTARLLNAAAALKLVEQRRNRYGLGILGAALVANPAIAAMVEHHRLLYADLSDPVSLLQKRRSDTALANYWPYACVERAETLSLGQVSAYSALMSTSQVLITSDVLDVCPLGSRSCLLDVGGGEGAFLIAVAARLPKIGLMLFELPAVAELARRRIAQAGLARRVEVFDGNFLSDPLPEGADIVTLVRVLHDHDDHSALALLRKIRHVLRKDGLLLIAEPMSGTGMDAVGAAYFGFYLLAMGSGRPRTYEELLRLLRAAGFGGCRRLATRRPMLTNALLAYPDA